MLEKWSVHTGNLITSFLWSVFARDRLEPELDIAALSEFVLLKKAYGALSTEEILTPILYCIDISKTDVRVSYNASCFPSRNGHVMRMKMLNMDCAITAYKILRAILILYIVVYVYALPWMKKKLSIYFYVFYYDEKLVHLKRDRFLVNRGRNDNFQLYLNRQIYWCERQEIADSYCHIFPNDSNTLKLIHQFRRWR